jgi:hypothetical protein
LAQEDEMHAPLRYERIRAIARVREAPPELRASDILIAMLATLCAVAGLLYFIVTLFPALVA